MRNQNLIVLFLNQNICCEYSKELSSLEHSKGMFKLIGKEILKILRSNILFIYTYA